MHEIQDDGFLIFMLAFVVIGLPVLLGVGSEMLKNRLKHKERMAEALTAQTAEKAANTPRVMSGWSNACACWSGSRPIAAPTWPTRSSCSATSGR